MDLDLWKPLAGLALFLLALSLIEESVRMLAGTRFKNLLTNHTKTPLQGIFSGAVATAVLQSSSFVSLMMLALVGSRLLPLGNAIAVVFGANLGTTATGWIVAAIGFKFDLEGLALPMIGVGGLVAALVAREPVRLYGRLCLALGLLLLGMQYMKGSSEDLALFVDPAQLGQLSDWHFLLLGIVFSAIAQSSSATMVVALSALHSGVIGLPSAVAIVIGADLGTTSTVIFGALGRSANKKRVALSHVVFNVVTDSIAFLFRVPILAMLSFVSDPSFALVAFHTTMNILGVALFLPFVGRLSSQLERMFQEPDRRVCRFLDDVDSTISDAAVRALEREAHRIVGLVVECNWQLLDTDQGRYAFARDYSEDYQLIKELEGEILAYALSIDRSQLTEVEQRRLENALVAVRGSVVSLKTFKEASHDLAQLDEADAELLPLIRNGQQTFYKVLAEALNVVDDGSLGAEAPRLDELCDDLHVQVHNYIMSGIRVGRVGELMTSTALNVNRLLFHSNQSLSEAVELAVTSFLEAA